MNYAILEVDEYRVYYYDDGERLRVRLDEARHRGRPLSGPYTYRKDGPHSPVGQYHLHLYRRSSQVFAINFDGTAHDQSHGVQIPNKVADRLREMFPDLQLPPNNLIEADDGSFQFITAILLEDG
jgi:hypothetical protein